MPRGPSALFALLGCLLWPAVHLSAQTARAPRPEKQDSMVYALDTVRIRLDTLRSRSYFYRDSMQSLMAQAFAVRRVRIGVVPHTRPSETDSIGVLIDAVSPGGPAAVAGIVAGDIIVRFGATTLAVPLDRLPPGTRVPSPGFRLVEAVAKLPPNDTVTVEYRRGKQRRTTRVVTAADPDNIPMIAVPDGGYGRSGMPGGAEYWVGSDKGSGERALELTLRRSEVARGGLGEPLGDMNYLMSAPLFDLELAPVNPQLGSYFGTTEGVLVVEVPDSAPLGLRAGDVVLSVDGRAVISPRQLMRVMGSYEPGEPMRLDVMRQKKRIVLKGTLSR